MKISALRSVTDIRLAAASCAGAGAAWGAVLWGAALWGAALMRPVLIDGRFAPVCGHAAATLHCPACYLALTLAGAGLAVFGGAFAPRPVRARSRVR